MPAAGLMPVFGQVVRAGAAAPPQLVPAGGGDPLQRCKRFLAVGIEIFALGLLS